MLAFSAKTYCLLIATFSKSSQNISNVKCYLFENGEPLKIGRWNNNLVKMATLKEMKAHRTAIQFCVQTGMTPIETYKKLKCTDRYSGVSRSLIF